MPERETKFSRQEIWRHNGLSGGVAMAKVNMDKIIGSETATESAKQVAYTIAVELSNLATLIRTRKDQE